MADQKVIVIGGGASGLMAAITAASAGAKVTILEHNDRMGKKLAATGNGKGNLTNLSFRPSEMYRGGDLSFVETAFAHFAVEDTISFFQSLGIYMQNKNGYLYPRSGQAKTIVNTLTAKAASLKIKQKTNEHVEAVYFDDLNKLWNVKTKTWRYEADAVILANGSKASMIAGADGTGYQIADELGLKIVKPLPALCSLKCKGMDFKQWAGVRTEGTVSLYVDDKYVCSDRGELQLTDYGISGIPVFQISRFAVRALNQKKQVSVKIDFLPDISREQFEKQWTELSENLPYKSKAECLEGYLPDKLSKFLSGQKNLISAVKEMKLTVVGDSGFEKAQVCSGGVAVSEIDPNTMEAKKYKHLYLVGELLDVDGICGGYNLQWAWTSGYLAGKNASLHK
ncbi:MAG: aminoacetone oxidase family FAD-binding enzyme [Eubacteriales bacterium]|nr:aminoacetone oxidase family FAD-binding enzyme [Eubacteriales bacterium]